MCGLFVYRVKDIRNLVYLSLVCISYYKFYCVFGLVGLGDWVKVIVFKDCLIWRILLIVCGLIFCSVLNFIDV